MSSSIFCIDVNQIPEFAMIAGTPETLEFNFFYTDGSAMDFTSGSAAWRLCPVGEPSNPSITLDSVINPLQVYITLPNKVTVKLSSANSEDLSGKYIQQPIIKDFEGNEYIYQQGIITVIPKIQV